MSGTEGPTRVEVDGAVFDVVARQGHPGQYDYAWISGPSAGYGFTAASSDGRPSTMADHARAIRNFLSHTDPETGYIE